MLSGREVETFDPLMPSQLDRVYSHRVGLEAPYFSTGRKAPLATSVAYHFFAQAVIVVI